MKTETNDTPMDYKQFEGHTPESNEQRIRKAGEEYANYFENLSSYRIGLDSYIIGATAENKRFFETVKEMETLIESLKLELKKQILRSAFKAGGGYARNEQWPDFEEWYESLIKKSSES